MEKKEEISNHKIAINTTYFSIIGNSILTIIKWFAGVFGNSYALIADAIESTADVFSSILVWFGIKYTNRPVDENHPYGHGRIEPLISLIVGVFLIGSAVYIGYQSIINIQTPHPLPKPFTLFVLGPIIIWKEISFRIVMRRAKKTNSSSLKADAWHHRSDAVISICAFIGISVALFLGEGYESADDWAALFACVFILFSSYKVIRPAFSEIMDEHVYDDLVEEIRRLSVEVEGVKGTEKCLVRKMGTTYLVDLHAMVDAAISVKEGHAISHRLKDYLLEKVPNLEDVLIHIEPDDYGGE